MPLVDHFIELRTSQLLCANIVEHAGCRYRGRHFQSKVHGALAVGRLAVSSILNQLVSGVPGFAN